MSSKHEQLLLLDEMIKRAQEDDLRHRLDSYEKGELDQTVGESYMLHHLKLLRSLTEEGDIMN
jgi:hypothetical protein